MDPVKVIAYMLKRAMSEPERAALEYALQCMYHPPIVLDKRRLQEIRKRCDAAWPGPWKTTDGYSDQVFAHAKDGSISRHICDIRGAMHLTDAQADAYLQADCSFIAEAREDVPYLLNLVESSGALSLEQLKQAIELHRPVYIKGAMVIFQREIRTDQWYFLYETSHHEIAARDSQGVALLVGHMETGLHPGFEAYS